MIFLDVGAHRGQTLEEVVKAKYSWDRVFAFEPMTQEYEYIRDTYRTVSYVWTCNIGLLDETGPQRLYGDNSKMEASIHSTHKDADSSIVTECFFVEASEFFGTYIPSNAEVIMKLNCEGSEVKILRNLLQSGEINKVKNVMIDFDVRKCSGQEHEEAAIIKEMKVAGFDRYSLCENVMQGPTHQDRVAKWLKGVL